jgi:hypothetical protein
MSFFKQFPKADYDLFNQGSLKSITDIYRHVDVDEIAIDPFISYAYYEISEGDRPDNVSQKLYGSTDYYWTFFIINDMLKGGLSEWPNSNQETEKYLTQEYDKYSVLTIVPELLSYTDFFNQGPAGTVITYDVFSNSLNGIDITHPHLRIRRENTNAYARVSHYDSSMYQLYVYGVNDPGKFFADNGIFYIETFNPYSRNTDDYISAENLNTGWREQLFTFFEKEHPTAHNIAVFLVNAEFGVSTYDNRVDYLKEYEKKLQTWTMRFSPERMNQIGRNAPKEYLSADGSEILSAYDALVASEPILDDNGDAIPYPYLNTYAEYEREKNDEKRKIRVVKKNIINEFVDAYKDLIQS